MRKAEMKRVVKDAVETLMEELSEHTDNEDLYLDMVGQAVELLDEKLMKLGEELDESEEPDCDRCCDRCDCEESPLDDPDELSADDSEDSAEDSAEESEEESSEE